MSNTKRSTRSTTKYECVVCKVMKSEKHFNLFQCQQCFNAKLCDECSIRASEPSYHNVVDVSDFSQEVILPFLHLFNLDLTCPLCRFQDVLLQNQETDKPQPIERYKTIHDVLVHLPKRTMELKQTTFLRQCTCEDPECGKSTLSASAQSLLLKRTAFKSFLRIVAANRHASA